MTLGDGDYKPSTELLNLFNTLPNELHTGESRDDVVVKSEVFDTGLPYREDSTLTQRSTCDGKIVMTLVWAGST